MTSELQADGLLPDQDDCPHEWERQNGAYGTDPAYLCICCGKVRTAESEADEQWL